MQLTIHHSHSWDVTPQQAREIQNELKNHVICIDQFDPRLIRVAGVDVGFENDGKITRAAIVLLSFPDLELLESSIARQPTTFPYVPGLLSFREIPAVLDALAGLQARPQLLLCDGHGYAHPRRFGLACHLGLLTDIPSIGVAKTRLVGKFGNVPERRGSWTPLLQGNEIIGAVLRSRQVVNPIFVSSGHLISLESSVKKVMECTKRFKLPETTRWAHRFASG